MTEPTREKEYKIGDLTITTPISIRSQKCECGKLLPKVEEIDRAICMRRGYTCKCGIVWRMEENHLSLREGKVWIRKEKVARSDKSHRPVFYGKSRMKQIRDKKHDSNKDDKEEEE